MSSHHESRKTVFGSFTANVKWLLAYFFLYFSCFEILNKVKKFVSSELRPDVFLFENKTVLIDCTYCNFFDEKK